MYLYCKEFLVTFFSLKISPGMIGWIFFCEIAALVSASFISKYRIISKRELFDVASAQQSCCVAFLNVSDSSLARASYGGCCDFIHETKLRERLQMVTSQGDQPDRRSCPAVARGAILLGAMELLMNRDYSHLQKIVLPIYLVIIYWVLTSCNLPPSRSADRWYGRRLN